MGGNNSKYVMEKTPCYDYEGVTCNIPKNLSTQEWMTLIKYLKHGAFGSVYRGELKDMPGYYVAVKQQYSSSGFRDFLKEIQVNKEVNVLVNNKNTPNFVTLIDYFICPSPNEVTSVIDYDSRIGKSLCNQGENKNNIYTEVSIYELADGDLTDIEDQDVMFSLICQTLISYEIAYRMIGFLHNDFKPGNVLFKKVPTDKEYFVYKTDEDVWVVPNFGYISLIGDFGLSGIDNIDSEYDRTPIEDYLRLFASLGINTKLINTVSRLRDFMTSNCDYGDVDYNERNYYIYTSNAENMFTEYNRIKPEKKYEEEEEMVEKYEEAPDPYGGDLGIDDDDDEDDDEYEEAPNPYGAI